MLVLSLYYFVDMSGTMIAVLIFEENNFKSFVSYCNKQACLSGTSK